MSYNPVPQMSSADLTTFCNKHDRLILKPSIDSSSGVGVMMFERTGDAFIGNDGSKLDTDYLLRYGKNFILQEAITQHEDLALFNPTSVNTIRLVAYRSVVDEKVYALSALLRIGQNGAFVDNAHAGGKFVGIDPKTGKLNNYLCDQMGVRYTQYNNIEFGQSTFFIPHWDRVLVFVAEICCKILHHRYISLDITVDKHGTPKLIEFNVSWTGFWASMFSGQLPLGDKTEEILEYCYKQKIEKISI